MGAYDEGADFTTRKIPLDRALMTGGYTPRGDPQRRNPSKRYFPRGSPPYLSERPRKQTRLFSGHGGRTEIGFESLGSFFFRKAPQLQTYLSGGGGVVSKAGVMTPLRRTSRLISRKGFRRDYVTSRPRPPFLLGNSIPKWIIHSIRHVVLLKNEQLVPLPQNVSWKANINLENPIVPNSWIKAYKKLWKAYSMRCMNPDFIVNLTDFDQVVADTLPSKISNVPGKESNGESRLICFQAFSLEFFSIF